MKALVLDFDGVISDSAPESFVVALRTYVELRPDSPLEEALARIHDAGRFTLGRVRGDPLYARFVELMPLGNRGEDFGVILSILERRVTITDQLAYDRERDREIMDFLHTFHKRFYEIRTDFSRSDPEGWRGLLGPYFAFLAILRRRAAETTLAIATAKDHRSVEILLHDYAVADLFPGELVLDKETGVSKVAHLEHLHRTLRVPYPELTFVDDKVNHLDAVAHLGVNCVLATWGYNGAREHRIARERGYRVCSLDDVEAQLFDSNTPPAG